MSNLNSAHRENSGDLHKLYGDMLAFAQGNRTGYVPDISDSSFTLSEDSIKLISFYLPQFHPIPENDAWWGKGFTEWTNVTKAVPNFVGHYQPRLPDELGFYDLRILEIQQRQIELAKKYGIYGFCFYYYWFSGKRLLEKPLNQFIDNELDFPFCICWANENWTRRWDGAEQDILIEQTHSTDGYIKFIRDVAPILANKRYIRVDGKPLLAVYRISHLPDPKKAAEVWRKECRELGIGEIYLVIVESFDIREPLQYGFDAAIEFPPHNCINENTAVDQSTLCMTNSKFTGNIWDYRLAAQLMIDKPVPDYEKFRTIIPSWDNTARRQDSSDIFVNASPAIYKKWLKEILAYTYKYLPEEKQFVFINAWNEWGEGAYLEPDKLFGYSYLQATKEALDEFNKIENKKKHFFRNIYAHLAERDAQLTERDAQLTERDAQLDEYDAQLAERDAQLHAIQSSKAWKVVLSFRKLRLKIFPIGSLREKVARLMFLTLRVLKNEGFLPVARKIKDRLRGKGSQSFTDYQQWLQDNEPNEDELANHLVKANGFSYKPLISVIMPVYNPELRWLRDAIASVKSQVYPNWELCIADDASSNPGIRNLIELYARKDARINYVFRENNGHICAASNSALELATGEYVALLDHDDKMHPLALYYVVEEIINHPDAEVIYSDEDKLNQKEKRINPYFKPDFDYDLLLSHNMISHLGVYKLSTVRRIGGFRIGLEGSQDYDLALRIIEEIEPQQIYHIPRVLYHWRISDQSTAAGGDIKPYATTAAAQAIEEHLIRKNIAASVEIIHELASYQVHYSIPEPQPSVEIVIYAHDLSKVLEQCVNSVLLNTQYHNYKISICLNNYNKTMDNPLFMQWNEENQISVIQDKSKNKTKAINQLVRESNANYICILDEKIEKFSAEWLDKILGCAIQPGVGTVGPKILYPDDTIHSNGVVFGGDDVISKIFIGLSRDSMGHCGWVNLQRGFSALSGECLLVKRTHFLEVGGIDEHISKFGFSVIDLCLRLKEKGLRNIIVPFVELYLSDHIAYNDREWAKEVVGSLEQAPMHIKKRWQPWINHDPAFSQNLEIKKGEVVLTKKPRSYTL